MEEKSSATKQGSQCLKTGGGKTESAAIEVPSISLPKGGGAIKGIDEKFTVNAINGTASFSIPLPVSHARGATAGLSLSYNSESGNGSFGLGWTLDLPAIKRKTEKGLPLYQLEPLALPYENYQLAFTPELVQHIFATRVNDTLMAEGKFIHSEEDNNWWIRSGTAGFIEPGETVQHARDRFF